MTMMNETEQALAEVNAWLEKAFPGRDIAVSQEPATESFHFRLAHGPVLEVGYGVLLDLSPDEVLDRLERSGAAGTLADGRDYRLSK